MREMTPFDTLCLHKCDTNMADSNRRQAVSHVSENQEFKSSFRREGRIGLMGTIAQFVHFLAEEK